MSDNSNTSDLFSTSDLGTAVFLFTTGHQLVETELLSPKRLNFHFEKRKDTEAMVARYLGGQAEAPARRLFENYRALRALTFQRTGNLR